MNNIKHVFFDLDRTLWDFETNSRLTLEEIFSEFGLADRVRTSALDFITEYKRINELFWNDYRGGLVSKEELRFIRFETALAFFGVKDRKLAEDIGQAYIDRSPHKTAVVEGSFELLEYLKPKYKLHIITNGFSEVQHIKMANSGIEHYFDQVIISESVGHKKPSVEVFRFAENASGARPEESIMTGDHFEADIVGALNAGWQAVLFDPDMENAMPSEDFILISSLLELRAIL